MYSGQSLIDVNSAAAAEELRLQHVYGSMDKDEYRDWLLKRPAYVVPEGEEPDEYQQEQWRGWYNTGIFLQDAEDGGNGVSATEIANWRYAKRYAYLHQGHLDVHEGYNESGFWSCFLALNVGCPEEVFDEVFLIFDAYGEGEALDYSLVEEVREEQFLDQWSWLKGEAITLIQRSPDEFPGLVDEDGTFLEEQEETLKDLVRDAWWDGDEAYTSENSLRRANNARLQAEALARRAEEVAAGQGVLGL